MRRLGFIIFLVVLLPWLAWGHARLQMDLLSANRELWCPATVTATLNGLPQTVSVSGTNGALTSAGQPGSLSASWSAASPNQDAFQRVKGERAIVLRRVANGTVNGPATLRADLNGRPVDLRYTPATGGNWSREIGLTSGTNTLTCCELFCDRKSALNCRRRGLRDLAGLVS